MQQGIGVLPARKEIIRVALAGNPNSGKTTVFNALTGGRRHTGNYPGVTVEAELGWYHHNGTRVEITDLPGTYSLSARTLDEKVARDALLNRTFDVVVCIADAFSLERSLYLAVQIMELSMPMILVLNKNDLARASGYAVDQRILSRIFGIPVVPTVATKKEGIEELRRLIADRTHHRRPHSISYGEDLDRAVERLQDRISADAGREEFPPPRWVALKLLEGDEPVTAAVLRKSTDAVRLRGEVENLRSEIQRRFSDDPAVVFAERRYGVISGACQEAVCRTAETRHRLSDALDAVIMHPLLGIPIFLAAVYLLFKLTFSLGQYPGSWIEHAVEFVSGLVTRLWPAEWPILARSLLTDGIISGVGNVLVFLPNIGFLFLGISILEDSGYMARAAFIMDRLLHKIGLHGRSFIPLLLGFGCSVPAVMATRTIEGKKERLTTMMIIPLMSCSARFTVYALIIPAFFPPRLRAPVLWTVYLVGVVVAIGAARLLRNTIFKGEGRAFVMELPPYRMPTLIALWHHMWFRTRLFVRKAGTIILLMSVVMWFLTTFPRTGEGDSAPGGGRGSLQGTYAAAIGRGLEPVLKPMGFDWRIGTALVGAVVAKEVFISQLAIIFAVEEEKSSILQQRLRESYPPLVGCTLLLFILISMPCIATMAAVRAESGSWLLALAQLVILTVVACGVATGVYQLGVLLGIGV
ncbi:MAG TPA: ferrous iron transport protein B [Kiritimatiellae bacterium]|nr:ferrous iron transport protein B [Kiritimatiellia bacterium]